MQYNTWKAIDEALSELEERVGLPDFAGLADEIGKALRFPPTMTERSIAARTERFRKIKRIHARELDCTKRKVRSEVLRNTSRGKAIEKARCKGLDDAVRMALVAKDIPSAENALDKLILDFPIDETTAKLCEDKDRVVANLKDEEDRKTAKCLKHVNDLSVVASCGKSPQIVVAWAPESSGLATEYKVVREDMESIGETSSFMCATSPLIDTDIEFDIPYRYTVLPCYRGIAAEERFAIVSDTVIATKSMSVRKRSKAGNVQNGRQTRFPFANKSVYDDISLADGECLTIRSLTGDVHVGDNAKLTCKGSCYGDVDIDDGGKFRCSSLTGDVHVGDDVDLICGGSCYGDIDAGDRSRLSFSSITGDVRTGNMTDLDCKGSCYGDVTIGDQSSFRCEGLTGDVHVGEGARFVSKRSCYGDVEIEKNGVVECVGSLTGDIINRGGKFRISGSFYGKVVKW